LFNRCGQEPFPNQTAHQNELACFVNAIGDRSDPVKVRTKQEERRELWRQRIAEQENGGQSVRAYCGERGLKEPAFYGSRGGPGDRHRSSRCDRQRKRISKRARSGGVGGDGSLDRRLNRISVPSTTGNAPGASCCDLWLVLRRAGFSTSLPDRRMARVSGSLVSHVIVRRRLPPARPGRPR
jgi:hypothetical protein